MTESALPSSGSLLVLVGTRKGAFILTGDLFRRRWQVNGPYNPGTDTYHLISDPRAGGRILAASNSMWFGPQVEYSDDFGKTWEQSTEQPRFRDKAEYAEHDGPTVSNIWHIEPGRRSEPGTLYAGVQPAALFKSTDGGATWHEQEGLGKHPTRPEWMPGFGGLCLHSIALDPQLADRMWVGISAAGVFRTDDGGETWKPTNRGVRADFNPADPLPEWGQCPHKLLSHPTTPGLLYQQNHCGVFRSDDYGDAWTDITEGLPSRFGFVLGLHHTDPQTLFVLPEDEVLGSDVGGGIRYASGARFRVFRSRTGGQDWEPLTNGLPQEHAYLHVLREGMATDMLDPLGIYVGTVNGQIFYSRDEGDNWELLVENLPPINSVEVAAVA
ncbi:MAG: exo-alpha-sialidase [Chloroflexota bacterium]|nr:exo-alpha-sialidase [Chloroflexota bacterium]